MRTEFRYTIRSITADFPPHMNLLPKTLSLTLLSAVLALTGCVKKPSRPDPSSTVMGQAGGGGLGDGSATDFGATDGSASGLETRTDGSYEEGDKIFKVVQPVFFETDKSGIKESERSKLQAAKEYLDAHPEYRILFEGRCDWRGTSDYNLALGDRRSGAAKKYIETLGVPATKIETLSKGDMDAKENAVEADMANDRRVEIIFLKK